MERKVHDQEREASNDFENGVPLRLAHRVAWMGREMESLEREFKAIEATYTENMMSLTLGRGYIKKLLDNARVVRFLNANRGEILAEFEAMAV